MKRRIFTVLCSALALILILVGAICLLLRHELKTLTTLNEKYDGVYTMEYDGDYGFDDFLKVGAKSDSDIEGFVTNRLLKGLPIRINVTGAGCTCFVSKNENNEVIFARNFDFEYAPMLQIYTKPDNGYKSVSTVNLSFAGYDKNNLPSSGISFNSFLTLAAPYLPFDGMNEKGVCMALLAVPESDPGNSDDKVTLNTTTAIRLVLDKASNVDEAVDLLRQYNIYFSGDVDCHYLIADASGQSVLIEYYDGGLKVVEADTDYQIATNFIAYNDVNIGEGFTEFERYEATEQFLIEKDNTLSIKDCENILNEVGVTSKSGENKLQWSVVYNLSKLNGRIWPQRKSDCAWSFNLK